MIAHTTDGRGGGPSVRPDPYTTSGDRWLALLPPHTRWQLLEDRLITIAWYPKQALPRLRVFGTPEGHELILDPASREVVIRLTRATPSEAQRETAERLVRTLFELGEG